MKKPDKNPPYFKLFEPTPTPTSPSPPLCLWVSPIARGLCCNHIPTNSYSTQEPRSREPRAVSASLETGCWTSPYTACALDHRASSARLLNHTKPEGALILRDFLLSPTLGHNTERRWQLAWIRAADVPDGHSMGFDESGLNSILLLVNNL